MACIEQMQRMYKLGDTYMLRIFEVKVQNALLYQDAEKACGFMTSGSGTWRFRDFAGLEVLGVGPGMARFGS